MLNLSFSLTRGVDLTSAPVDVLIEYEAHLQEVQVSNDAALSAILDWAVAERYPPPGRWVVSVNEAE